MIGEMLIELVGRVAILVRKRIGHYNTFLGLTFRQDGQGVQGTFWKFGSRFQVYLILVLIMALSIL